MSWTRERARVASLSRSRHADDPELIDARRNLRAERLAAYIEKVVAQAPPLTKAQEDKLVTILRSGSPTPTRSLTPEEAERHRQAAMERKQREDALRDARRRAAEIVACHACGHPPEASIHGSGWNRHEWEPKR